MFREEGRFNDRTLADAHGARGHVEHKADWVILGDADEFWWPRGGSLKDDAQVPRGTERRGLQHNFVPVAKVGSFAERMTFASRRRRRSTIRPALSPGVQDRRTRRATCSSGQGGAHQVFDAPGAPLTAWHPVEILHLPLRSREQGARKYEKTWSGWQVNLRGDLARAHGGGRPGRHVGAARPGSETVRRGLDDGMLAMDARLRDALRDVAPIEPTSSDAFEHVAACVFREAESVRGQRWLDDLTQRVDAVDNGLAQPPRDGR